MRERQHHPGLSYAARREAAVRQEMFLLLLAFPLGFIIAQSPGSYVAMIGTLIGAIAVEFLSTAIEKLADRPTLEWDPLIGLVKDVGSAAVFCALLLAGVVWMAALGLRLEVF